MTYQEYIGSREWRENSVRLAEFRATGFLCRICSRGEGVTIKAYRRTYENLNHERPGDLTALWGPATALLWEIQHPCSTPPSRS
jgi:hypothetical protein